MLNKYLIAEIVEQNKKTGEFTEGELMEEMLKKGPSILIKDIYKN